MRYYHDLYAAITGKTQDMKLLSDESGASAAEYAVILAVVGSAIVLAALGLADAIAGAVNETAACIEGRVGC